MAEGKRSAAWSRVPGQALPERKPDILCAIVCRAGPNRQNQASDADLVDGTVVPFPKAGYRGRVEPASVKEQFTGSLQRGTRKSDLEVDPLSGRMLHSLKSASFGGALRVRTLR
jgi:hypothetical protein